jgi:hypothetical protein
MDITNTMNSKNLDNSNLDVLNIDNYSFDDLKSFLKIDGSKTVSKEEVDKKADDLIEKLILNNDSSDVEEKKNMLKFINQARERLTVNADNPFQNSVTILKKPNFNENTSPVYSNEPHFVQNTHSISNKFPNQIDTIYRTRLFVFNTLYCDEFLHEDQPQTLKGDIRGAIDYTFTLVNPIRNVMGMTLSALQYPNVQPTFSVEQKNVYMYITVDTGHQAVIQMDAGFFTSANFSPILEQNINDALYGYGSWKAPLIDNQTNLPIVPNFRNPFSVSISPYSNRVSILNTRNNNFKIIFDMPVWDNGASFYNRMTQTFTTDVCAEKYPYSADLPEYYANNKLQPNTLGFQIGYRKVVYDTPFQDIQVNYYEDVPGFVYKESYPVKSFQGEGQYDDGNGGYVYFCVNEFANNSIDDVTGVFPTFFFNNNTLALIPITSSHFTNTLDTGADYIFKSRNYTGPIDISKLVVSFYNSNGIKITFNQIPFSFALEFKILYDNPATIEKIIPRYNGLLS